MERTTFLKNYRIRLKYDGSPYEPDRDGLAISYEAVDERTAEPVSVTLIQAESIDPSKQEQFEEYLSVAQKLRHANIAKVLDFGREGDDYVYVSERLPGETLASWVRTHGPTAADATLRIGEQVVSVLSSAGFHKLPYPSIQPSNIMLVPGQTAEGSWPLVKVTNFGLPALMANPEPELAESNMPKQTASAEQVPGNQQFSQPTRDIRSEIYSLGVTLYFLLTGTAMSAEALQQSPKLSGFPKPLRALLGRMMHRNPDQRPTDLLVVTEMIRGCLEKIERRRELSDRYGIPFRTNVPRRTEARPRRLVRTAVAVCALLVLAAAIAPLVFPESIGKIIRASHISKPVGVLIGVPESSPPAQAPQNASATASAAVASQPVNPTVAPEPSAAANTATTANPPLVAPVDTQQAQASNAQSQVASSTDSAANSAGATPDNSASADTDAKSAAHANAESPPTAASKSSSQSKKKSVASNSRRAPQRRAGSVRSRFVGITSDGRLILRLPSGRTAIVAPDEEELAPRHRRRVFIDRDQMYGPPPGFGSDYFPHD